MDFSSLSVYFGSVSCYIFPISDRFPLSSFSDLLTHLVKRGVIYEWALMLRSFCVFEWVATKRTACFTILVSAGYKLGDVFNVFVKPTSPEMLEGYWFYSFLQSTKEKRPLLWAWLAILGGIFVRTLDGYSQWRTVDGEACEIEVGPQGAVYCTDSTGDVYVRTGACNVHIGRSRLRSKCTRNHNESLWSWYSQQNSKQWHMHLQQSIRDDRWFCAQHLQRFTWIYLSAKMVKHFRASSTKICFIFSLRQVLIG